MSTELMYLTLTATITALFWVPYLMNAMAVRGLRVVLSGTPQESEVPLSPWARRLRAAHSNATENLGVFASLILVAHVAGVSNMITLFAAGTYFWARIAHYLIYGLGIPVLRTVAFVVGWIAQLTLMWQILNSASW